MRIKKNWKDPLTNQNQLPDLEYWLEVAKPTYLNYLHFRSNIVQVLNRTQEYSQYAKCLEVIGAHYTKGSISTIIRKAINDAKDEEQSPQVEDFFKSKEIIDDEQSANEKFSKQLNLETEIPGETSKRKHEIDDQIVLADPNEKSLQDLLGAELQCSESMMLICQHHNEFYPGDSLIDLRPNSNFIKQLPSKVLKSYLKELDNKIENLIPSNIHDFLTNFFNQDLTYSDWNDRIDDLQCPDKNDQLMVSTMRILHRTLPSFIMAFSLGPRNPLLNLATLERPHLNSFVHPCLQAALWYISSINYEFGEISTKNHKREFADGVGYLNTADKFQLVYMEGSRPNAKDEKEMADASKISNNLQKIFLNVVKDNVKCRRRLPESLSVFGGQSFRLRIHLQYMDYCGGKFRLNEVDNANIPRDVTEMGDFVFFYECIIKWALLVREVKESFETSRAQKRPSRVSYINSLNVVDTL